VASSCGLDQPRSSGDQSCRGGGGSSRSPANPASLRPGYSRTCGSRRSGATERIGRSARGASRSGEAAAGCSVGWAQASARWRPKPRPSDCAPSALGTSDRPTSDRPTSDRPRSARPQSAQPSSGRARRWPRPLRPVSGGKAAQSEPRAPGAGCTGGRTAASRSADVRESGRTGRNWLNHSSAGRSGRSSGCWRSSRLQRTATSTPHTAKIACTANYHPARAQAPAYRPTMTCTRGCRNLLPAARGAAVGALACTFVRASGLTGPADPVRDSSCRTETRPARAPTSTSWPARLSTSVAPVAHFPITSSVASGGFHGSPG
jgi:hypothetical protein